MQMSSHKEALGDASPQREMGLWFEIVFTTTKIQVVHTARLSAAIYGGSEKASSDV